MHHGVTAATTIEQTAMTVHASWRAEGGAACAEMTRLTGVTPRGATLDLRTPPALGQLLRLTLPGPGRAPRACPAAGGNTLWALVWAVAQAGAHVADSASGAADGALYQVSVVFAGEDVPAGVEGGAAQFAYLAEEDGRFRLQQVAGGAGAPGRRQRRRESRLDVPVEVTVEVLAADGAVAGREQTVTENISRGGAAVWTSLAVAAGQFVRLRCESYALSLVAVVRARREGPITRLHLQFLDGQWPLEGE